MCDQRLAFFSCFASFFSFAVFCGAFFVSFLASLDFIRVNWAGCRPCRVRSATAARQLNTKSYTNEIAEPGASR